MKDPLHPVGIIQECLSKCIKKQVCLIILLAFHFMLVHLYNRFVLSSPSLGGSHWQANPVQADGRMEIDGRTACITSYLFARIRCARQPVLIYYCVFPSQNFFHYTEK
jgi:hypothetical protein